MFFDYKVDVTDGILLNLDLSINRLLNSNDMTWLEYDINSREIYGMEIIDTELKNKYPDYNYIIKDKYQNIYLVNIKRR